MKELATYEFICLQAQKISCEIECHIWDMIVKAKLTSFCVMDKYHKGIPLVTEISKWSRKRFFVFLRSKQPQLSQVIARLFF